MAIEILVENRRFRPTHCAGLCIYRASIVALWKVSAVTNETAGHSASSRLICCKHCQTKMDAVINLRLPHYKFTAVATVDVSWQKQKNRLISDFGTRFQRKLPLFFEISEFPYKAYNTV